MALTHVSTVASTSTKPEEAETLQVRIVLPPDGYTCKATPVPDTKYLPGRNEPLPAAFQPTEGDSEGFGITFFEIHLRDGFYPDVTNFGMPFCNPGHPAEQWLRRNQPFFGEITLQHVLQQRLFSFVVARPHRQVDAMASTPVVPKTIFESLYGHDHAWNIQRYMEQQQQPDFKGPTFEASLTFQDDNEQVAVVTQSIVQDYMWLHDAKKAILQKRWPAYFIPCQDDSDKSYFVVLYLSFAFRQKYNAEWRVFSNERAKKEVRLFDQWDASRSNDENDSESDDEDDENNHKPCIPDWKATIVDGAEDIDRLKLHLAPRDSKGNLAGGVEELVLRVRRPDGKDKKHVPNFKVVEGFSSLEAAQKRGKEH